jgi:hypothetical protein
VMRRPGIVESIDIISNVALRTMKTVSRLAMRGSVGMRHAKVLVASLYTVSSFVQNCFSCRPSVPIHLLISYGQPRY